MGWEETPWRSKVIRVSIVAVGSVELVDVLLAVGENADERSCAMLVADQVVVMLSWNLGSSITRTSEAERRPRSKADAASSSLRVSPKPLAFPKMQMSYYIYASSGRTVETERRLRTTTQTEYLDMVTSLWCSQSKNRWRKEHGFIIGMCY